MSRFLPELQKALRAINENTVKVHRAKELTKQTAVLQYKKIQLLKAGKPAEDITNQIQSLESTLKVNPPTLNIDIDQQLVKNHDGSEVSSKHISNIVTFLNSQREYTELIERYNPGLTMDQEDKVRRTANRVGLSVPEN